VTEIHAEANARVDHYRAQLESTDAFHTGLLQAAHERDSYVGAFSLSFGAAVARNDIGTRLNGSGCECSLDGLYAVRGRQHVDHHTAIDHAMPHCHSHQLYKGVLDENAKGVFNGKIFVRRDAQKTDAVQSNKNLLLSDNAEVNTKPQLEIDANDVRCTHGATIGQLDGTAAFYLRSRGIDAAQARNILTYAFAADALERIQIEPLKNHFESLLLARFAQQAS
jgi:Fe-S cluster assembly protein SufD